jgi:cation diffusion facilitator CzcD-associated flavoprotein CzcO
MTPTDVPVVVIGGGGVGLSFASELGWRGIPCVLLEQRIGIVGVWRLPRPA